MGWNPANWSIVNTLQGQNNTAPATNAPSDGVDNVKIGGLTPGGAQGLEPPRMSGAEQQAIYDYYDPGLQGGGSYDPAAAAAAAAQAAATQAARNSFNSGRTNIYDSARGAVQGTIGSQRNNILDFVDSLRNSQQGIDQGRIKAQLGKDRATTGIMGMVGRGIQSGATMLANRNAGDSSASGAIAKAYGDLGNRQQSDVNNQFGMQQEDFNISRSIRPTTSIGSA